MGQITREYAESEDADDRCQGHVTSGQCPMKALPGDQYCRTHGGRDRETPALARKYMLIDRDAASRVAMLSKPDEIYSLRDEIGMCRMMLERRLNMIENDAEMLAAAPMVNQQLLTLERLIKTSSQVEIQLGQMMAKDSVLLLASKMMDVVSKAISHLPDHQEIVDRIVEGTYTIFDNTSVEEVE